MNLKEKYKRKLDHKLLDIRRKIQWSYERAQYGYSEGDLFDFDVFLAEIISEGINRIYLREREITHPDEEYEAQHIEYVKDLKEISNIFGKYSTDFSDMESRRKAMKRAFKLLNKRFAGLWL